MPQPNDNRPHVGAPIDLRSDAVTQPTDAMWHAMRAAPPHWSAGGGDPSVLALEARAAELTGKAAALFVPTGTIANLLALMAQVARGEQVIVEQSAHILWSEEWSLAFICGAVARPLSSIHGALDPDVLRAALADRRFSHQPRTSLICLENTHNAAGGTVLRPAQLAAVAAIAREHDVPIHLDGARLCNAQVALGISLRELSAGADTVALSLSKGLSAPGGALLCGPHAVIETSRVNLKRLGAHSLTNTGIHAAAGLVALDTMIPRLAEDHRRARRLAEELAQLPALQVDLDTVQTNIVMATLDDPAFNAVELVGQLAQHGVLGLSYSDTVIRFVTHRHITDADVERVIAVARDVLCGRPGAGEWM